MRKKYLRNRLGEPLPENCPLSEALVWLISGTLPISSDDYKFTKSESFEVHRVDSRYNEYIMPGVWGKDLHIDEKLFTRSKTHILLAIVKGKIRFRGRVEKIVLNTDDVQTDNPEELSNEERQPKMKWDSYAKEHEAKLDTRQHLVEIPSGLLNIDNINWSQNLLESPSDNESGKIYFTDVEVSAEELFVHFVDYGHDPQPLKKPQLLIPVNEALSLIVTGSLDSESPKNESKWSKETSALIRLLRNGFLVAEGYEYGSKKAIQIDKTEWAGDIDISKCQTQNFEHILVTEYDIRLLFEIPEFSPETIDEVKKTKKGRPPIVEKEVWLEELLLLFKSEKVLPTDKQESVATALKAALKDNQEKNISVETIRRDWIGPLYKKLENSNGGK